MHRMAGHQLTEEVPEIAGVVEVHGVAQFVEDDVVDQLRRQVHEAIIKIEILFGRATPPHPPRIFDPHLAMLEWMHGPPIRQPRVHQCARRFFVRAIGHRRRREK